MSTRAEQLHHEIAAKGGVDAAREALDLARRREGAAQADLRQARGELRNTTDQAHSHVDELRRGAPARARAAVSDYLAQLRGVDPVPPPPDVVAAALLAVDDRVWDQLHRAIDQSAGDPHSGVFTSRSRAEIEQEIADRESGLAQLRQAVKDRQRELAEAQGTYDEHTEGG